MHTGSELSAVTNRSVTWDHMLDQLKGIIYPEDAQIYVETLMLQTPHHAAVGASTFHYANIPQNNL